MTSQSDQAISVDTRTWMMMVTTHVARKHGARYTCSAQFGCALHVYSKRAIWVRVTRAARNLGAGVARTKSVTPLCCNTCQNAYSEITTFLLHGLIRDF